jgi:tetratricopeptide (TPR) repeat protein
MHSRSASCLISWDCTISLRCEPQMTNASYVGRDSPQARLFPGRKPVRNPFDERPDEHTIALYERALNRDPNNFFLLLDLAYAYAIRGHFDDSERMIARVLELYPRSEMAHFAAATLYHRINRPLQAIVHYRQALEFNPQHPKSNEILVSISILAGQYGMAWIRGTHSLSGPRERLKNWSLTGKLA